jgi:methylated-DNA-[protein]-cysteine S-methyltransferase
MKQTAEDEPRVERMLATLLRPLRGETADRSRLAAAGMADRATRAGLLDVAYGFADSPFGRLLVAVTPRGIVRVEYPNHDTDEVLEELAAELSPRVLLSARATEAARRELEEYFEGRRKRFDSKPDLSLVRGFNRQVLEETARIPFGTVTSYRDVAQRSGSPRAARAAGNALARNPIPIVVPCHRVVHSGGGLGGYTGGLDRKIRLLELESALRPEWSGTRR